MRRWTARITPGPYLRISYLVGTVVDWAGALDERKAGRFVDLPGALARGRHAPSVAVGIPLFRTLETCDAFCAEKYWTEVGDQIGARE